MLCCVGLQEREAELASLRRRAHMVTDGFNQLEDVTCNFTEGAMYSFPQVGRVAGCRTQAGPLLGSLAHCCCRSCIWTLQSLSSAMT